MEVTKDINRCATDMDFYNNQTVDKISIKKLVGDETVVYIEIALFVVISGTVAVFGCLANMANITVFVKQGFQESSNISLLCLSVTDFMLCLATVGTATTSALDKAQLNVNVDFGAVNYIIALIRGCCNDLSMCTIVFLSLERCLCVVKPLTFKHIISRTRSVIILGVMYTEVIIFQALILSGNRLTWQFSLETNSTYLQLNILPLGNDVVSVYQIVNGVSLSFTAMILVSAASCCMAYGLMKAAQFRMGSASVEAAKGSDKASSSLTPKDVRVVKMVVYVSVMFVVCYLPFMIIFCIRAIVPEVGFMKAQHNLNETFWGIIYSSVTINSASNILVYFRVSSKYRDIFLGTFCGRFSCSRIKKVKK